MERPGWQEEEAWTTTRFLRMRRTTWKTNRMAMWWAIRITCSTCHTTMRIHTPVESRITTPPITTCIIHIIITITTTITTIIMGPIMRTAAAAAAAASIR